MAKTVGRGTKGHSQCAWIHYNRIDKIGNTLTLLS